MDKLDRKLWPYKPWMSLVATLVILFTFLTVIVILRSMTNWPSQESERLVLLGIFIISAVPLLLVLVDTMSERGGSLEYRGLTINFSQVQRMDAAEPTIPANIGVPGQTVGDSGSTEILSALERATASESVIIDLEAGQAWWETRLLVLVAGAVRHNKPSVVVFVGTDGGKRHAFQGWSTAAELLPLLLRAHPKYATSYQAALAAARQWELAEPQGPNNIPAQPQWIDPTSLAARHSWMVFNHESGLPNPFYAEQLLASELGEQVEQKEPPRAISLVRLESLFRPVLHREQIDREWSSKQQLDTFFAHDAPYVAVTENGRFKSLISRLSILNNMLGTLVKSK